MKNILIVILIVGVFAAWFHTDKVSIASLSDASTSVFNNQEYVHSTWNSSSDPKLLIEYCSDQFSERNNVTDCSLAPNSAEQAKLFANALWKVWSGHTHQAEEKFKQLQQEEAWLLWGKVGLLELANHTGNQNKLGLLLDRFKQDFLSSKNDIFIQSYNYFELWHAHSSLEWVELEDLLNKYTIEQITSNSELLFMQSSIYLASGQKEKLGKLLNQARPEAKKSAYYVYSLVYLTDLKLNVIESDSIIKRFAITRPEDDSLALAKARLELLDDNKAVSEAALKKILDITKSHKKDVRFLLDIREILFSNHKFEAAKLVFKSTDLAGVVLEDFVMFKTVLAWEFILKNRFDYAISKLEEALNMAPRDLAANWLKVLIAKKLERPDLVQNSLKVLLDANPYNQSYRNQISHFRNKYKTPEFEVLYKRMIEHH